MYATSRDLTQNLELQKVLEVLFKQSNVLIPVDFLAIYLGQSPDRIRLHKVQGLPQANHESVDLGSRPAVDPLVRDAWSDQQSKVIADVAEVEAASRPEYLPGLRSWLAVPLKVNDQVTGVCEFAHRQPNVFTPKRTRLAEGMVSQAAVAIQNASLYDDVRSAHEQLQTLTHKIMSFQEHERRYLAKALYDEVGQSVAAVMFQLKGLDPENPALQSPQDCLAELEDHLSTVSIKLHNLANDLRPASLDFLGLQSALSQYLNRVQENAACTIHFQASDLQNRLAEVTEIVLFRIAQEAVDNAIQHAQAATVSIQLLQQDNQITLMIADDGIGFSVDAVDPNQCFGLLVMRERAEMIGGHFSIRSAAEAGTTITVSVPA
jgi:signal transduction histidine kinase